jgi:hypothetical protein
LLHALQEGKTGVLVLEGPELLGDIEATLLHTDLPLLVRQNPMHASQTWGEDTTMKIPLAIMGSARGV